MAHAPVLEELLTVVGGEQDQGVLVEAAALQLLHEQAELEVVERDLRVVEGRDLLDEGGGNRLSAAPSRGQVLQPGDRGPLEGAGCRREAGPKPGGRGVGGVGVDRVHVDEEPVVAAGLPQPAEELPVEAVGRSDQQAALPEALVDAEGLADPGVRVESVRAVSRRPQQLGESRGVGGQRVATILRAMGDRREAREERGDRGLRPGRRGDGTEDRGLPGEGVDVGRDRLAVPVAAEMIDPERVDEVDEDVGPPPCVGRARRQTVDVGR